MDVSVLITFATKPESCAAFRELLAQVRVDLPRVPGCKGVRIFHHKSTPCTFTLLETWESETIHRAHVETLVRSGTWERIAKHLAADPVSIYCEEPT